MAHRALERLQRKLYDQFVSIINMKKKQLDDEKRQKLAIDAA